MTTTATHLAVIAGVLSKPEAALKGALVELLAWLQGISQPFVVCVFILGVLLGMLGEVLGIKLLPSGKVGRVIGVTFLVAVALGYGPDLIRSMMAGGA